MYLIHQSSLRLLWFSSQNVFMYRAVWIPKKCMGQRQKQHWIAGIVLRLVRADMITISNSVYSQSVECQQWYYWYGKMSPKQYHRLVWVEIHWKYEPLALGGYLTGNILLDTIDGVHRIRMGSRWIERRTTWGIMIISWWYRYIINISRLAVHATLMNDN